MNIISLCLVLLQTYMILQHRGRGAMNRNSYKKANAFIEGVVVNARSDPSSLIMEAGMAQKVYYIHRWLHSVPGEKFAFTLQWAIQAELSLRDHNRVGSRYMIHCYEHESHTSN